MHRLLTRAGGRVKPSGWNAAINTGHPLARSLVGAWLLNEGAGSLVKDYATGIGGTLLSPVWNTGDFGGPAPQFASGTRVECGDFIYGNRRQGTVSAWINTTTLAAQQAIISATAAGNDSALFLIGISATTGRLYAQSFNNVAGNNNLTETTTTPIAANTLTHVAVSSDGGTWRLYANGAQQSTTNLVGTNIGQWFAYSEVSQPVKTTRIGWLNTTFNYFFSGRIDSVLVFDHALTPGEILDLYNAPYAIAAWRSPGLMRGKLVELTASSGTLKTFDGLARANIKTIGGLAIAGVKTYQGLTP